MGRTVVIAQARMSSTRLPGKSMADLAGKPVVDRVIERARRCELADDVWVATTTDPSDDSLAAHLGEVGVPFVRGSLDDVLDRYALAAREASADTVVRITCDCPLIDPVVIDEAIAAFHATPDVDYCSNCLARTYPIGMDTEVFSASALRRAASNATAEHEREHVTPYIYQHPDRFRLLNVEAPEWATWPELRLTVDEPADLDMLRMLLGRVPDDADLRMILNALREAPDLQAINAEVTHRHVEKPDSW